GAKAASVRQDLPSVPGHVPERLPWSGHGPGLFDDREKEEAPHGHAEAGDEEAERVVRWERKRRTEHAAPDPASAHSHERLEEKDRAEGPSAKFRTSHLPDEVDPDRNREPHDDPRRTPDDEEYGDVGRG